MSEAEIPLLLAAARRPDEWSSPIVAPGCRLEFRLRAHGPDPVAAPCGLEISPPQSGVAWRRIRRRKAKMIYGGTSAIRRLSDLQAAALPQPGVIDAGWAEKIRGR